MTVPVPPPEDTPARIRGVTAAAVLTFVLGVVLLLVLAWRHGVDVGLAATGGTLIALGAVGAWDLGRG